MRLLALDLLAYGPFTGTRLDFAAGQQGLHLVYGPNEAGKSSALRALTALLYGFEPQNRDNFIHQYKDLRVGGTLLHTTGEGIEVIRRKGQKNTLLDEAGQPLGETALDRFLGGASKELFRTLFGIDHVQLLAGGQEILAGGGQVGAALFAAGTGFVGLRQLAEKLRGEALDLFKPRGQNQTINALIKQHGEVRRVRDAQVLRGADWQHHDQALRDAQARRRTVLATLQARQAEQAHLERIRQALPHIARRGDLLAALQELADAVLLPTDFSARRIQSFERLEGVRRQVQALEQELERIETEHTGLTLDHCLLERGGEIQRLVRGSDAFAKAIADLTKLRVQANDKERSVRTLAREIRPDLTPERIEIELDVPKVQRDGIRELGNQHGALLARRSEALRELEQLKTELAKKRQTLAELGAAAETSALQRAIERVQRSGDLDGNLASVNKKLALEQAQATAELHRLGGWDGELEALERLTLPTLETVDAFHDRFTDLAQRQAALAGRLEATRTAVAESRRQLDTLRLAGAVPDEQALQQARTNGTPAGNWCGRPGCKASGTPPPSRPSTPTSRCPMPMNRASYGPTSSPIDCGGRHRAFSSKPRPRRPWSSNKPKSRTSSRPAPTWNSSGPSKSRRGRVCGRPRGWWASPQRKCAPGSGRPASCSNGPPGSGSIGSNRPTSVPGRRHALVSLGWPWRD